MIYGLYLSATGVLTNSYRQDVIANNLANADTVGFKKDLALFQERRTEARARGTPGASNPMLEALGGGTFASPNQLDVSQGEIEPSNNNLDVAIEGRGYFTVNDKGETRLTRNGHFTINRAGHLALDNAEQQEVLDTKGQPIAMDPRLPMNLTTIGRFGEVTQDHKAVGQIGVFDVPNPGLLQKRGGTMMSYPQMSDLRPATGAIHNNATERGNVEPATELAQLMDAQRQLEANANMIRYQDQTLQKLANEVGKIS